MFTLIILGLVIGLISSFFGVGGGFITVPILLTLFSGIPHSYAVGASLAIIAVNASINSIRFHRSGRSPQKKILAVMIVFIALGSISGTIISSSISTDLFKIFFITLLFLTALNTLLKRQEKHLEHPVFGTRDYIVAGGAALLAGLCSGLLGIGGGIVLIPIFAFLLRLPYSWLSAYSNATVMFGAIGGTMANLFQQHQNYQYPLEWLNPLQFGAVNIGIMALIFCGSFLSGKWGVKLGLKIAPRWHRLLFGILLLAVGVKMALIN